MTRISVASGNSMTWICENRVQLHAEKNEVQCRVQCFVMLTFTSCLKERLMLHVWRACIASRL